MSLQYQLITHPANSSSYALTSDLAQLLIDQGVLKAEHFLQTQEKTPQTPAWLIFLQHTDNKQHASDIIVDLLNTQGFSWHSEVVDIKSYTRDAEPKTAFEAAFPYCSVSTVQKILSQLSEEQKSQLRENAVKPYRVSLLNALNHNRRDLADVLLSHGWDLEQVDQFGATNLLRAQVWTTAKELLDCGANVLASDHNQSTIWDRVQNWGSGKTSSADIIKEIKQAIAPKNMSAAERKRAEALEGVFHVIAEQKITNLSRRWTTLQSQPNPDILRDSAGRSVVRALCEKAMGYHVHEDKKEQLNFFFRVASFLYDAHQPQGWIDLDQPLEGFAGWTERDHLYTTLTLMMMDGRVNLKSVQDSNIWQAYTLWQNNHFATLAPDFDRWLSAFNRLEQKESENRVFSVLQLEDRGVHEPWKKMQRALLKLPEENPWCQRVLKPFHSIMEQIKSGEKGWSGGPAHHTDWLARWALTNNIPVDNFVWDILTMKALQTITSESVYRGRPIQSALFWTQNTYMRTVLDNELHMHPRNRSLLNFWVNELLKPGQPTTSNPNPRSLFESKKDKMDDTTLAFFSKIFLVCQLDGTPGVNNHAPSVRKM